MRSRRCGCGGIRLAGFAHMLIFLGFGVLLARTLMLWGRGFDEHFGLWVLGPHQPLGKIYSLLKDVFVVLVVAGTLVFVYFRWCGACRG